MKIGEDVLKIIFSYCDNSTLGNSRTVSKKCYNLIQQICDVFCKSKKLFFHTNPFESYCLYKRWTTTPLSSSHTITGITFSSGLCLSDFSDLSQDFNAQREFLEGFIDVKSFASFSSYKNKMALFYHSTIRILDLKKFEILKNINLGNEKIITGFYLSDTEIAVRTDENHIIMINLQTDQQHLFKLKNSGFMGFFLQQTKNFLIFTFLIHGNDNKKFHLINKINQKEKLFYEEERDVYSTLASDNELYLALLTKDRKLLIYKDQENEIKQVASCDIPFFKHSTYFPVFLKFYNGFIIYKEQTKLLIINPSNGEILSQLDEIKGTHVVSVTATELTTRSTIFSDLSTVSSQTTYYKHLFKM